jgi:hypothetical protein
VLIGKQAQFLGKTMNWLCYITNELLGWQRQQMGTKGGCVHRSRAVPAGWHSMASLAAQQCMLPHGCPQHINNKRHVRCCRGQRCSCLPSTAPTHMS